MDDMEKGNRLSVIKVGVVSLGCSKNRIDSEVMMGYLSQDGYSFTPDPNEADIVVVNTCGFIEAAKEESIDAILDMAQYKQNGTCSTLVVTGCLAQRYRAELQEEIPEIDVLIGVSEYEKLPALLNERYASKKATRSLSYDRVLTTPAHYAYIRVAEGCDHHCSFCAIPAIRGPYRSRSMQEILEEAETLQKKGVKELIVIAQDTARYGMDLDGQKKLPELLSQLAQLDFQWIRLLYSYPEDIDDALLDVMCEHENIVKYLDMPIQHVDDRILKRMNRRGNREYLTRLIQKIRNRHPDFIIRTTCIVGFPGETESEFQSLCDFIRAYPVDRMGVFAYSPEDGTPAAKMPGQIPAEIAQERLDRLMRIQQTISKKRLQERMGKVYDVVIEEFDSQTHTYAGRSFAETPEIDGCIVVEAREGDSLEIGTFVSVNIVGSTEYDLIGKVVDKNELAQ